MATSYEECYEVFLRHINDSTILYPMANESDSDYEDRLHNILFETFKSSIVKFFNSQTLLSRDDNSEMFVNDLRPLEVEIVGMYMLREYYRKQMNYLASLKHSFSDKDFKSHDKSNEWNQYRQIIKELNDEIDNLIIKNSFADNDGRLQGWWSV